MDDHPETDTAEFVRTPAPRSIEEMRSPRPAVIRTGAASHRGKVRAKNEDQFLVGKIRRSVEIFHTSVPEDLMPRGRDEEGHVLAVADGMGGAAAGEKASQLAIMTGLRLVLNTNKWSLTLDPRDAREFSVKLQEYFNRVDDALIEQARQNPSQVGMGTTLVVAYSVGDRLIVVHAGDSRAYLLRGGSLERLTRDHTLAQLLAESGQIRHDEVNSHPKRHVLTNYLGGPTRGVKAEIQQFVLRDDDRVLLCSDGLTEMVSEPAVASILAEHPDSPQDACHRLIEAALAGGGSDNITVALAHFRFPEEPAA